MVVESCPLVRDNSFVLDFFMFRIRIKKMYFFRAPAMWFWGDMAPGSQVFREIDFGYYLRFAYALEGLLDCARLLFASLAGLSC